VLPQLERLVFADYEQHFSESVMLRMLESHWGTTPFIRRSNYDQARCGARVYAGAASQGTQEDHRDGRRGFQV
jgi:hypothetical protein